MRLNDVDRHRELTRTHQRLYQAWKRDRKPCIICAEREGKSRDHLPPEVLFPAAIRTTNPKFFTFPVCHTCNNGSSDQDFLFSFVLSLGLNQDSIRRGEAPSDPDLLALYEQTHGHLHDDHKRERRERLLRPFIGTDLHTGRPALDRDRIPVFQTLTKIVKSIYWLHTDGDILERHKPGWWIRTGIDTSKKHFVEKLLATTNADMHWEDRFIARYMIGHPENDVGGFVSSSLHFYTKRELGSGMSWLVFAAPSLTSINGQSLYELSKSQWGAPTIEPRN